MKKIDRELAEKVIGKYDEILQLLGDNVSILKSLNAMTPEIESILRDEHRLDDPSITDMRDTIKLRVLEDVIVTVAMAIGSTLSVSGKTMEEMSKNKDAVKAAVNEYFNEQFGGKKDGK